MTIGTDIAAAIRYASVMILAVDVVYEFNSSIVEFNFVL